MKIIIDPVAFSLGFIRIRWYGILIGAAILLGVYIVLKEAKRQEIDEEFFLDFFLYGIPGAVVGARIYYVIFTWSYYSQNPSQIFAFREGGLAIHGAILGGLLVLIILVMKRNKNFWKVVDILAPALALGQALGRWGNFINQEAYGGIVSSEFISYFPDFIQKQMYIQGEYRNPAFLYESMLDLSIFLFLLWLRRRQSVQEGDVFLSYIILYSAGRFFIEGIRTDSLMLGTVRVAQLISVILILSGIIGLYLRHKQTE